MILSLHSLEVGNSCQYPFRLSGYLLFLWLLITLHLAGAWSDWVTGNTTYGTVVVVYTIAPIIILVSVYARVRYVLVKHMPPASELINLELQAFENEKSHLMLVMIMLLLSVCCPALYLSSCYHRTHNGIFCFTCLLLLLQYLTAETSMLRVTDVLESTVCQSYAYIQTLDAASRFIMMRHAADSRSKGLFKADVD